MSIQRVGYARLIERSNLPALPPARIAVIDSAIRGRVHTHLGEQEAEQFPPSYQPEDGISADLQFALRYEGINLEVLALLFAQRGKQDVEPWIGSSTASVYARRAGFLYEWLTGDSIAVEVSSKLSYVSVLDTDLQFGLATGTRNAKFRVIDNLPGNRNFCPLVRKTTYLQATLAKDLKKLTQETLGKYDQDLLRRAATFLYLKETQSSFDIEREKPSASRAQRFADLLREAESNRPLSEDRFLELQNAVVDSRFREASYRNEQNWIGKDLGYRKQIAYVPPRPADAHELMQGLIDLSEYLRKNPADLDAIVAASCLSFGFVYIHPFMDGNGRLHRYLIHEVLSTSGFTPKGIVLPVSAVILASQSEYEDALDTFSKPLTARTTYNPEIPKAPASGNDAVYYRYFDATTQTEFLCRALERTIEHDLDQEISYLLGFDKARRALGSELDWPAHSLDLFIRVVHQNDFKLSKGKRDSHFQWMTEEEVSRSESIVAESFAREE